MTKKSDKSSSNIQSWNDLQKYQYLLKTLVNITAEPERFLE